MPQRGIRSTLFGRNVRARREALGLSQETLAERAQLHRTYVGSVERGERNISLENIVALARALDVRAADLVAGVDDVGSRRRGSE